MLNHMQHFVADAVHIFCFRSGPSDYYHRFSYINIRIGYPFIGFTFEHEITGIFERNAAASQIPKIKYHLNTLQMSFKCFFNSHFVFGVKNHISFLQDSSFRFAVIKFWYHSYISKFLE